MCRDDFYGRINLKGFEPKNADLQDLYPPSRLSIVREKWKGEHYFYLFYNAESERYRKEIEFEKLNLNALVELNEFLELKIQRRKRA